MSIHPLQFFGPDSANATFRANPPLSLYIHVPWCVRKCPYCDFNSHEARDGLPEQEYVAALVRDLEVALPQIWGRTIHSIFIGGGTPSLLSGESVSQLLRHVRTLLPLNPHAEITLEANPGTVETERFALYRDAGVNRLSLGIQSLNDAHLQALGRIHSAGEARRAIEIAQQHFDNVNVDLMYALPNQTLGEALQDVNDALSFQPQHLSCYHLTVEPNTLFHHHPPSLPDDDISDAMQSRIEALLTQHGYGHYETSAFALPNKQSRHNRNYWLFGDYLGIGAGAHSKLSFPDRVVRQARHKQPRTYLEAVALGVPIQSEQHLSQADLAFEFMMNALRLNDGFDAALFSERTGLPLLTIRRELEKAERRGLIERSEKQIAPTKLGRRFLNDLLEIFLVEK